MSFLLFTRTAIWVSIRHNFRNSVALNRFTCSGSSHSNPVTSGLFLSNSGTIGKSYTFYLILLFNVSQIVVKYEYLWEKINFVPTMSSLNGTESLCWINTNSFHVFKFSKFTFLITLLFTLFSNYLF